PYVCHLFCHLSCFHLPVLLSSVFNNINAGSMPDKNNLILKDISDEDFCRTEKRKVRFRKNAKKS
ncbi:MAG: hypothetical protein M1508_05720, partial [Nitrospirae bacterium]|nr:hypothetical protein [Nitrospirota bacterium]